MLIIFTTNTVAAKAASEAAPAVSGQSHATHTSAVPGGDHADVGAPAAVKRTIHWGRQATTHSGFQGAAEATVRPVDRPTLTGPGVSAQS